jgi:hypothetical protein
MKKVGQDQTHLWVRSSSMDNRVDITAVTEITKRLRGSSEHHGPWCLYRKSLLIPLVIVVQTTEAGLGPSPSIRVHNQVSVEDHV